MSAVIILVVVAGMLLIIARQIHLSRRAAIETHSNENEPDVFASPDADLDPESDTGEPQGRTDRLR